MKILPVSLALLSFAPLAHAAEARAILRLNKPPEMQAEDTKAFLSEVHNLPKLEEIADRLVLQSVWNLDSAQVSERLARSLALSINAAGDRCVLSVTDESSALAAGIANAAASVIRDHLEIAGDNRNEEQKQIIQQWDLVQDRRVLLEHALERMVTKDQPPKAGSCGIWRDLPHLELADCQKGYAESTAKLAEMLRREVKSKSAVTVRNIVWARIRPE